MIKTQTLVPTVYYRESRDFQLFGRLYDIIFNYAKTNVDLMNNFPISKNTDSKLLELLSRTLGFEAKSNYHNKDLNAICSVFIQLMKEKGSLKGVERLIRTILNAEGIDEAFSIQLEKATENTPMTLSIYIPDMIINSEIALLESVLEYILPAGVMYTLKEGYLTDSGEIFKPITSEKLGGYRLVTNDKQQYSNISITTDDSSINTVKNIDIGSISDISTITSGDIRYVKVAATQTIANSQGEE